MCKNYAACLLFVVLVVASCTLNTKIDSATPTTQNLPSVPVEPTEQVAPSSSTSGRYPYPAPFPAQSPTPLPSFPRPYPEPVQPSATPTSTRVPQSEITPLPTMPPIPTLLPTIDPTRVGESLINTLIVEKTTGIGDTTLYKIHGGEYGFRPTYYCGVGPYTWMDEDHLLLFPIIGEEESMGITSWTRPVVLDYLTGKLWIPPVNDRIWDCDLPEWSHAVNNLFLVSDGQVQAFSPEGSFVWNYPGDGRIDISPSGRKALFGSVWVDLETGRSVDFHWESSFWIFKPAWSADETRLYYCCHNYGDAISGKGTTFEIENVDTVGRGLYPGFEGVESHWMLDDSRIMIEGTLLEDINTHSYSLLIDPEAQSYQDIISLTGLSETCENAVSDISPNGSHLWVACSSGSYLVYLQDFFAMPYSEISNVIDWSSDGRYALLAREWDWIEKRGTTALVDVINGTLLPFKADNISKPAWSPGGDSLAHFSEASSSLEIIDFLTRTTHSYRLNGLVEEIVWNPVYKRIVLLMEDGSLWLVPDIASGNLEQLTSSMLELRDLRWSYSGEHLAFISGQDIFVIANPGKAP